MSSKTHLDIANPSPLGGEGRPSEALAKNGQGGGYSSENKRKYKRAYKSGALSKAKYLRKNMTEAEKILWKLLRRKQLQGYRFRKQQPIGPYIADFVCFKRKLIIELDGGQHSTRSVHDRKRDTYLSSEGYHVLRFWNNELFENCEGVLEMIYLFLSTPSPTLPPQGGGSNKGITDGDSL